MFVLVSRNSNQQQKIAENSNLKFHLGPILAVMRFLFKLIGPILLNQISVFISELKFVFIIFCI